VVKILVSAVMWWEWNGGCHSNGDEKFANITELSGLDRMHCIDASYCNSGGGSKKRLKSDFSIALLTAAMPRPTAL